MLCGNVQVPRNVLEICKRRKSTQYFKPGERRHVQQLTFPVRKSRRGTIDGLTLRLMIPAIEKMRSQRSARLRNESSTHTMIFASTHSRSFSLISRSSTESSTLWTERTIWLNGRAVSQ